MSRAWQNEIGNETLEVTLKGFENELAGAELDI